MKPMILSLWLSLLLGAGSVSAIDPSNADRVTPGHSRERHAREAANAVSAGGARSPEGRAHHDEEARQDNGHGRSDEHTEEGPADVHLTPDQVKALDIRTERLEPRALGETLRAPGEVRLNAYASAQIAPRIVTQVTGRHAKLGDRVEAGQPMVTLSSVEMAEAQGKLVVAEREWQRVRELGRKVVSESRYLETEIGRQQAWARVIAFGMTPGQVDELLQAGATKANGTFALLAPQAGTVVADNFVLGDVIEAGRTLFEITDESVRWVEARLPPEEAAGASLGDSARVRSGTVWLDGKVTQLHHQLDETTRTQAIRIEVPDPDHRLHPGVFVDVELHTDKGGAPVLALPEAAVLRGPDGDWQVFVAGDERGSYKPVEVTLVRTTDGLAVIEGLVPGTEVVIQGAFFLQSELAKSGFDIHNH